LLGKAGELVGEILLEDCEVTAVSTGFERRKERENAQRSRVSWNGSISGWQIVTWSLRQRARVMTYRTKGS
jgi:hypothetical protein